jgi:hypothetical protein
MYPAILRLSARIDDLERDAWKFEAKVEGGDYVHRLSARSKAACFSIDGNFL